MKFIKPKMGAAMMSKGKSTKAVGRSGEEKESDDDYVDDDEGTTLSAPVCLCRSLQSGRVDVFLSLLCFLVPPCAFNSAFPLAIFLNASTLCLVLWMQRKQKLQTFRKRGRLFPPKRPRRAVPPRSLKFGMPAVAARFGTLERTVVATDACSERVTDGPRTSSMFACVFAHCWKSER